MSTLSVRQKLDWYDQVTFDRRLAHRSVRIAHAIGKHFNGESGSTFIAHETLADRLGISTKSVERSVMELERHGYLAVIRPRGRSRANVYAPVISTSKQRRSDSLLEEKKAEVSADRNPTKLSQKPDSSVPKTRPDCRPYPSCSLPRSNTHTKMPAAEAANPAPASPSRYTHANAPISEPGFIRQARLAAQAEARQTEQEVADRLTIPGQIDGRAVVLNLDPQTLSMLCAMVRKRALTATAVATAHAEFRALSARGLAIEPCPSAIALWRRH